MINKSIEIDVSKQILLCYENGRCVNQFKISTARRGLGEQEGSEQTPRGKHKIRAKIGAGQPMYTVFVGRRPSGEIYTPKLKESFPTRDWILTRILWLSGTEPGKNRLGKVDTMRRYIYIHGTADETDLGIPVSHGCIRMNNRDIIQLFDWVEIETLVFINYLI